MKTTLITIFISFLAISLSAQGVLIPGQSQVNLSGSKLTTLPKEVIKENTAQSINFSNNSYFDLADSVVMPTVLSLDLSHTMLNPWNLDKIGKAFPNLEELNLSATQLSFIGSRLQTFGKLKKLNLSNNDMEIIPYEIQNLSALEELNISNNKLVIGTVNLGYLWKLKRLDARNNPTLNPEILLLSLSMNDKLTNLALSAPDISPNATKLLAASPVASLELDNLTKGLPAGVIEMRQLKRLSIESSFFNPENEAVLSGLKQLEYLSLKNTSIPMGVVKLRTLDTLILSQNASLWKTDMEKVKKMQSLKVLDITGVAFKTEDLIALKAALPTTQLVTGTTEISGAMKTNTVEAIVSEPIVEKTIFSTESTTIIASNTIFEIPKDAFLTSDNKVYNGPVDVKVKVFDDAFSIALEGAPMTYSENGRDELFSSNGMIDFRATTPDGQELQPNPSNQIQVTMKNLQPDQATNLYQYNDTTGTWKALKQTPRVVAIDPWLQTLLDSINKQDYRNSVDYQPVEAMYRLYTKYHGYDPTVIRLSTKTTKTYNNKEGKYMGYYEVEAPIRELLNEKEFRIDTVLSKKQADKLKNIKFRKYEKGYSSDFTYEPRLMWHVRLTPDLAHDNYRLTFNIKDSSYSLPVTLIGDEAKSTQKRIAVFEQRRYVAQKEMDRLEIKINEERDSMISVLAEQYRQRVIANIQAAAQGNRISRDQLQFGLTSFGLINCDYFKRNPVSKYVGLSNVLTDQNNQRFDSIPDVRVIMPDDLTYIATTPQQVPVYNNRKNYGIVRLSENLIGVFIIAFGIKDNVSKIRSIDITGKNPEQVRELIIQE